MGSTSEIRKGLTIRYNSGIYSITEFLHVKPGKGPAFVRTKLKNLKTGKVLDNTFPSGAKIDIVRVERRKYQYLYREGDSMIMMHNETYEQIPVLNTLIPNSKLVKEGEFVEILFNTEDENILTVDLPASVVLEITYTEPGIRGDTATNTLKPATVETGAEVRVPLFCNIGDKVKIDTSNGNYMERAK
ncbi:MAG TPA: elongation factor P [Bacteroidetes bacterium]|nr:elongation factor P [Bacteroidota bacterium]